MLNKQPKENRITKTKLIETQHEGKF